MNIGIIFAGGVGERMNSRSLPKQFLSIQGKPIIIQTLEHFENCTLIDGIIIACVKEWIKFCVSLCKKYNITKIIDVVPGGNTGQLSIYNGLLRANDICKDNNEDEDIVLIHDGVRPLISKELLNTNIETTKKYRSCLTCVPANETIAVCGNNGDVIEVTNRDNMRIVRAPQCFFLKDILKFHKKAIELKKFDFIDSCTLMQYFGNKLHMVEGPTENIKITTPGDFYMMRSILQLKEDSQLYGLCD